MTGCQISIILLYFIIIGTLILPPGSHYVSTMCPRVLVQCLQFDHWPQHVNKHTSFHSLRYTDELDVNERLFNRLHCLLLNRVNN